MSTDEPRVEVEQNGEATQYGLSRNAKAQDECRSEQSLAQTLTQTNDGDKRQQRYQREYKGEQAVGELDDSVNSHLRGVH